VKRAGRLNPVHAPLGSGDLGGFPPDRPSAAPAAAAGDSEEGAGGGDGGGGGGGGGGGHDAGQAPGPSSPAGSWDDWDDDEDDGMEEGSDNDSDGKVGSSGARRDDDDDDDDDGRSASTSATPAPAASRSNGLQGSYDDRALGGGPSPGVPSSSLDAALADTDSDSDADDEPRFVPTTSAAAAGTPSRGLPSTPGTNVSDRIRATLASMVPDTDSDTDSDTGGAGAGKAGRAAAPRSTKPATRATFDVNAADGDSESVESTTGSVAQWTVAEVGDWLKNDALQGNLVVRRRCGGDISFCLGVCGVALRVARTCARGGLTSLAWGCITRGRTGRVRAPQSGRSAAGQFDCQ